MVIVAVRSLSHVWLFMTPWTAAHQASLSFSISWTLLKFMSTDLVMPTISSSVSPFSSCPQSFPASGSFPMNRLLASGGQSIGASASHSVLPMTIQGWFPLRWTGWISLQSKGWTLKSLLQHHNLKASILWHSAFFMVQLSHLYITTRKTIVLAIWTLSAKRYLCFLIHYLGLS